MKKQTQVTLTLEDVECALFNYVKEKLTLNNPSLASIYLQSTTPVTWVVLLDENVSK